MTKVCMSQGRNKCLSSLLAIGILVLTIIIFLLPVMAKWRGIFHDDHGMSGFPVQYSLASNLQKGIIPMWNPYTWCGAVPFNYYSLYAGNNYYPLWLFFFFADLSSFDNAYWMISILPLLMHYILAATGMFILLKRAVNCSSASAFAGAFVYIYSPVFSYLNGSAPSLIMLGWLPWLLYIYIKNVQNWRLWRIFSGGVIFAFLWISGRPHFMPFIMIIFGSVVYASMVDNTRHRRVKLFFQPLLAAFLMFFLGSLLAAVFLVPSLDVALNTQLYTELSTNAAFSFSPGNLPLSYLVTLFVPNLFGSITGINFIFKPLIFCEANMSGGMVTTLLVVLGLLMPFFSVPAGAKNKIYCKFALISSFLYLVSILLSLGGNTPFYQLLIGWIPWVGGFPFPIRYRFIQCFAASILIAISLQSLTVFKLSITKYKLKWFVSLYVFLSFCVVGFVLFLPQDWKRESLWLKRNGHEVEGFFALNRPFGLYTPKVGRVKKIRMIFDSESEGEIRYAAHHTVHPRQGVLAKSYYAREAGWIEVNVDIPPNKFIWIYPKTGKGRIGYWTENNCSAFRYDGKWFIYPDMNAIGLNRDTIGSKKSSLISELKNRQIVSSPIVTSLLYWLVISFLIIGGTYFLSLKKLGYFLGVIVLIEFIVFGTMAFYGTTYTHLTPSSENFRYMRPSNHPMVHHMTKLLPSVVNDSTLRIASDDPHYDNFVSLNDANCRFALMGYGIYPLERRFKHAIETAYDQPMHYGIYEKPSLPANPAFLNNFSVGYFLSRNQKRVFTRGEIVPFRDGLSGFAQINDDVLPRAYTIDKVIPASDRQQLQQLVYSDLRKAAYVSTEKKEENIEETEKDYISHFKYLQQMNPILDLNLDNPNQISVDISVGAPSMLVFTEVWYPGWEATVNGKNTKIHRVNYCQRGIWLENGNYHVELKFRPLAWRIGVGISLTAIILMFGVFAVVRLRRRKEKGERR